MKTQLTLLALSVIIWCSDAKLPEETMTVPEIIEFWGYPIETHEARTVDGYYLTLHRIPHGREHYHQAAGGNISRPVAFLQHGLLCTSHNWIANFPYNSLAFMLADAGFDVWMGNVRGNTYSLKHETLSIESERFWDFSIDEIMKYDFPAMIEYTLLYTNKPSLYYIGHSQGTMMAFGSLSENVALQAKIKIFFALSPITRLVNIYTPLKVFAPYDFIFRMVTDTLRIRQFLPSSHPMNLNAISRRFCPIVRRVCSTIVSLIAGYSLKDLDQRRIPIYLSHTPAGTSVKIMFHYTQMLRSRQFQKYDYGWSGNLLRYNSRHPPVYRFESILTPMVLIGGTEDWVAAPSDVAWTTRQIPNLIDTVTVEGYNHLDFVWGKTAHKKVYKHIIADMKKWEEQERQEQEKRRQIVLNYDPTKVKTMQTNVTGRKKKKLSVNPVRWGNMHLKPRKQKKQKGSFFSFIRNLISWKK